MDIYLKNNSFDFSSSSKIIGCKRKSISSTLDLQPPKINNNNNNNNNDDDNKSVDIEKEINDNNNKKFKSNQTDKKTTTTTTTTPNKTTITISSKDSKNINKDNKEIIKNLNNNNHNNIDINNNTSNNNKKLNNQDTNNKITTSKSTPTTPSSSSSSSSFQYFKQVQEKYVKEWDWKSASKKAFSEDQNLKILEPKKQKSAKSSSASPQSTLEQTVIDAGQKNVGQMVCQKCKMLYSYGSKEDEIAHQSFCNGNIQQQKVIIKNWQSLKIANMFHNGQSIIIVNKENVAPILSKINQLKEIVNLELGYTEKSSKSLNNDDDDDDEKLFLYIDSNGRVLGCLIAERIEKAYRIEISSPTIQCFKSPSTVLCGINRIWVLPSHRNRGIALKLLDALRSNMYYGYHLKKNEIAVTQPSTSGLSFFTKYFGTNQFLLFNINK